jgi:hypothetical protein
MSGVVALSLRSRVSGSLRSFKAKPDWVGDAVGATATPAAGTVVPPSTLTRDTAVAGSPVPSGSTPPATSFGRNVAMAVLNASANGNTSSMAAAVAAACASGGNAVLDGVFGSARTA